MWHWGKRERNDSYENKFESLYAALFAEAGYDTNIYARGKRLEALRNNGNLRKWVIKAEIRILENYQTMIFMILSCLLSGKTSCMKTN